MTTKQSWLWIFLIVVVLPAIVLAALQEEVEPFFKSRPRKWYTNDEKFGVAIREFHNKAFNHEIHRKLKHHFIVKYDPAVSCIENACVNILEEHFHPKRVGFVSPHHAIVTATAEEINAFRKTKPFFLQDVSPMLPSMKVDANLLDLDCSLEEFTKYNVLISGEAPYITLTEYETLLESIKRIQDRFPAGVVTMNSRYPETERRISILWTVKDCKIVSSLVPLLAALREIVWLERQLPIVVHNRWAKGLMETGISSYSPMQWSGNFTGEGQVIGVVDTGLDMMNCYFYDPDEQANFQYQRTLSTTVTNPNHRKVLQYISVSSYGDTIDNDGGHGTHVAGIAAGKCYNEKNYGDYAKFNGMAPDAKIAFMDLNVGASGTTTETITTPSDLAGNVFLPLYKAGARVITNSWGNSIDASTGGSSYTSMSRDVDEFMRDYPDALIVFSAGNTGYKNVAKTVSPPGNAKSCLTVGASGNDYDSWRAIQGADTDTRYNKDLAAYFSSLGPTDDSRLKPDITAPGFFTVSAKGAFNSTEPFCGYQILDGTSMAAPTAAGYALLVRQYFTSGTYPSGVATPTDAFTPSGALLKAMMIHAGRKLKFRNSGGSTGTSGGFDATTDTFTNISTAYPSTKQGYGRVQLDTVLHFGNASRNPLSLFVMGGTDKYNSSVLATGATSKSYSFVTSSDATQSSIRVTMVYTDNLPASGTSSSMVNIVSMTVSEQGGSTYTAYSVAGTTSSQPVKVVDIASPKPSTKYTISVIATSLGRSPQPFALVATGGSNMLTFIEATDPSVTQQFGPDYPFIATDTRNQIIFLGILFVLLAAFFAFVKSHTRKRKSVKVNTWKFNGKNGHTANDNSSSHHHRGQDYHDYGELGLSEQERNGGRGVSLFQAFFYKDPVQQAIEASRREEQERRRREQLQHQQQQQQQSAHSSKKDKKAGNSSSKSKSSSKKASSSSEAAAAASPAPTGNVGLVSPNGSGSGHHKSHKSHRSGNGNGSGSGHHREGDSSHRRR